jgi:transposase
MTETTIGIDISKATLDVHRLSDGAAAQFGNDKAGFRALKFWLKGHDLARVVYEPTGPYHRDFEIALEADYPLVKVNPLQARRFAQSLGTKAKTDAVDARMLAVMGAAFSLLPQQRISAKQRDLKELHVTRLALVKDRGRILNRQRSLTIALLKRQAKARLKLVIAQIAQVDAEIQELLQNAPDTARATEIICSVPGLSKVSSAAILTEMPEIGALSKKQVASLAGLAPMTRQSGQWRGKSFIQGGRKLLRDSLYMPALVAMRHNPDLKAKYAALIKAGKPAKVALVALMRRLIILVNTLIREDRKWEKNRA